MIERVTYESDPGTVYVQMVECPLCGDPREEWAYGFADHLFFRHEVQDLPGFEPIPEECDE